jgi:hypothetical protein
MLGTVFISNFKLKLDSAAFLIDDKREFQKFSEGKNESSVNSDLGLLTC